MNRLPLLRRGLAAALLAAVAPLASAGSIEGRYELGAQSFPGGGGLRGTLTARFVDALPPGLPFSIGSSLAVELLGFSASFDGSSPAPAATFELDEVISLRMIDDGTFGIGTPEGVLDAIPALFELNAFDDETQVELTFRFAGLDIAAALLAGPAVTEVAFFDGDVVRTRRAAENFVRLIGGDEPPAAVPSAGSWTLALAGIAGLGWARRRGRRD